jgi:hypothetical protein
MPAARNKRAADHVFCLSNHAPRLSEEPNVSAVPKPFPAVRCRRDRARPVTGLVHWRPNKRNRDRASEGRTLKTQEGTGAPNETAALSPRRRRVRRALGPRPQRGCGPGLESSQMDVTKYNRRARSEKWMEAYQDRAMARQDLRGASRAAEMRVLLHNWLDNNAPLAVTTYRDVD